MQEDSTAIIEDQQDDVFMEKRGLRFTLNVEMYGIMFLVFLATSLFQYFLFMSESPIVNEAPT